jgi:hypothetical protein
MSDRIASIPGASLRRLAVLAGVALSAACLFAVVAGPAPALASNETFCSNFGASPGNEFCHDPNLRLITRVNVKAINGQACAGAINTNGVEVGGEVCMTSEVGEASNGNYDGSKWLYGRIHNISAGGFNTMSGLEYFN